MVKYLVKKGADVNGEQIYGWTVLHSAATKGTLEIVEYLVKKGADVNGKKTNGWSLLHTAVTEGTLEMVKYLVEHGADVDKEKTNGWSLLHTAVTKGTLEMVKYLVGRGAVTGTKSEGETILHHAVNRGSLEMVQYLVNKIGADVNAKQTEGWTVLHYAFTKETLEMMKYKRGADVSDKFEIVRYLVDQGADVNGENADGWSVLYVAVGCNALEIVMYLVEQGASVNCKSPDGSSVLHSAVDAGGLEIVKYLVQKGADVNCKSPDGSSVLHNAVDAGGLEIVKYLVQQGADIALKSKISVHTLGIDILRMAVEENLADLVKLLLKKNIVVWKPEKFLVEGRQMSLLEWSIHLGHDELATTLKRSVKHREKIEKLEEIKRNQLKEIEIPIPMQVFVPNKNFKIGDGGNSCVYVALMKDGSEVAVKRILVQSDDEAIINEKEIMNLIKTDNSPFIVNYRHFHRDDTFMYLIVDLCEETLRELVHACNIEHLQEHGPRMIREILSGLEFLHGKGILHRDLKPSNVLVDIEGRMKLADFGISRILDEDETTVETFAKGTPGWMPPEVIEAIDKDEKSRFKKKSDVHVAGMISFFILTKGEHPFGSSFDRMRNILQGKSVNLEKLGDCKARRFVSWLINHKIDDRPYAHEASRDSFVNGH
ncbi:uncharacterized protein LOC114519507 [Dendronephthya gigantea]|uniref:uncharacterized protein LOC114519507 n=1 Tax=Dendronephthya gigantea TaxID=151771 RepID=UPI00106B5605|nr:uncharacterized protein LOC114519507 [Dendronephthya gigantea]